MKTELEQLKAENARIVEQNKELQTELMPFRDGYFKGLTTKEIAQLSKKSIRMTKERGELLYWLKIAIGCMAEKQCVPQLVNDIRAYLKSIGEINND